MTTLIKQVFLTLEDYGPKRGQLTGSVTFTNTRGDIKINLDATKVERLVRVLAEELVETAKETASLMVAQVLEQASAPAIER